MSDAITIARPYAQAAFDEAKRLGELKSWSGLLAVLSEAVSDPQIKPLVSSPAVSPEKLVGLMTDIAGGKLSSGANNFIALLVEAGRLDVAPEIAIQFESLRAEEEKSVDVTVTSAFDLNDAQKQKIAAALKERFGREVVLTSAVDKALLGGVVIRAGDKVIDGSARTRLSEMASALA